MWRYAIKLASSFNCVSFVVQYTCSKVDEKVAAAAVSSVAADSPMSYRVRHHRSIYTTEPQAILCDFKQACQSQESELV